MALGPSFRWGRGGGTHLNQSPTPCAGRRLALMPYTHRTPEQRAELERQAKALRAQGASMAEIERATGVPVPTLYQWAARGGWRACDLAELSLSSGPSGPSVLAARGQAPLAPGGSSPCNASGVEAPDPISADARRLTLLPRAGTGPGVAACDPPAPLDPTPENLLALAETAKREAMRLYRLGRAKEAREHLLTAQRFAAAAGAGAGAQAPQSDWDDPRDALKRRVVKLIPWELAHYLKAIEDGALEAYLEQRHARGYLEWRLDFWWPELIAARAAYPPYGFRDDANDDGSDAPAFLNSWLAVLMDDPNRPDFLKAQAG
jgi:hypothetical protein